MRSVGHVTAPVRIGVCIDDVGLRPGVTEAALVLCRVGRVSALSCMSDAPAWREAAATLVPELRGAVDFGLHLTLTEPWSRSRLKRPLRALVFAAYARALDSAAARDDTAGSSTRSKTRWVRHRTSSTVISTCISCR